MTAKQFAGMGSVWHRATPALEQFTRWTNRNAKTYTKLWVVSGGGERTGLIAETAFVMAREDSGLTEAERTAKAFLSALPGGVTHARLSRSERREAQALSNNIQRFLEDRSAGGELQFSPRFPGCGAVQAAAGDVVVGSELIEIKSVQRAFRGLDFRQVLTYAALAYAAQVPIDRVTLLNPRTGRYFTSEAHALAMDLGAGSWVELMQDLIQVMSGFDVSG